MATIRLQIAIPHHLRERLVAELDGLDFDAFEDDEHGLMAYIPADRWDDVRREDVEGWLRATGAPFELEEQVIADENWNARWEASIRPVPVGPFLIKPSWMETPPGAADRIILEIDPKMSFGTGHHASTRLALQCLPDVVRGGERVLDAGCGTGILSLGALRLGAGTATGFDIDPWAVTNADENAQLNGLADRFEVREGSVEVVSGQVFDVVLANINRNALLAMMPELRRCMASQGALVLSGVLLDDRGDVLEAAERLGLHLLRDATEDEWWAATVKG